LQKPNTTSEEQKNGTSYPTENNGVHAEDGSNGPLPPTSGDGAPTPKKPKIGETSPAMDDDDDDEIF
jgi:hypothetical protein